MCVGLMQRADTCSAPQASPGGNPQPAAAWKAKSTNLWGRTSLWQPEADSSPESSVISYTSSRYENNYKLLLVVLATPFISKH